MLGSNQCEHRGMPLDCRMTLVPYPTGKRKEVKKASLEARTVFSREPVHETVTIFEYLGVAYSLDFIL